MSSSKNAGKSGTAKNSDEQDIVDLIIEDHKIAKEYFTAIQKLEAGEDEAQNIYETMMWEIAEHAVAEEVVFYPLLEKMGKDGKALADESREDHEKTKQRVGEIDGLPYRDVAQKVIVAVTELVEHMEKEEQNDLPLIRQKLSKEDLKEAALKFIAAKAFAPKSLGTSPAGTLLFNTPYDLLRAPIEKVQQMLQEKSKGGQIQMDEDKPYNLRSGEELKPVVPFPEGPHDTLGLASHKDEKGHSKGNEQDDKSGGKSGNQQQGGKGEGQQQGGKGGQEDKSGAKSGGQQHQGGKGEGQQQGGKGGQEDKSGKSGGHQHQGGKSGGQEEKSGKSGNQQQSQKGENNQSGSDKSGDVAEDGDKRYNLRTEEEIKHVVPFPEGPHDTLGLQSHKGDKDGGKSGGQKGGDNSNEGSQSSPSKGKQSEDKSSQDKSRGDKSQHTSPSKGNSHDEKSHSGRNSRNGNHQSGDDSKDQQKRGQEDDDGQGARKKVALDKSSDGMDVDGSQ